MSEEIKQVEYVVTEFRDGDYKGFKYHTPEYNDLDKLVADFGKDIVLNLINSQILSRVRTKVKNSLPEITAANKAQVLSDVMAKNAGGVLFTEAQASEWRPDVRDLSIDQMARKAAKLFKEGKIAEGIALLAKAQAKAEGEQNTANATE